MPERKPDVDEALASGVINPTTPYRAGVTRPPRHHIFPRQHEDWFKARGVDVDRYTLLLDEGTHQALHYGGGPGKGGGWWNDTIMDLLHAAETAAGRHLTPREILRIGAGQRRLAGLSHIKARPYGSP